MALNKAIKITLRYFAYLPNQVLSISLLLCLSFVNIITAQRQIDSIMSHAFALDEGEEKARQFLKLASAFYGIERDTAEYFYQLASNLLHTIEAPELHAMAKTVAVEIHRQDWSLDTLKQLLEDASRYYESMGDEKEILEILITKGALYSNRGLYEDAIPPSLMALDLAVTMKDTLQQGKIAYNLGVVYYNTSMFEEAAKKFKEAQKSFLRIQNESMAGIALSGVVNVYLNTDRNDTALLYAQELLRQGDELQYSRLQLNARSNLGAIYNNLGNHELAVKYYRESEPFARRFGSKLSLINCWCALGKSLAFLNQLDSADFFFAKAYELNAGENMPIMHQFCSKEYANVLQRRGQHSKSSALFSEYVKYQDSILIKENKEVIAGLEAKYQTTKKDVEIAQQKFTIEQRTSERNLYLFALLFSVGLAGFAIYRFRQNKKLQTEKIANLEKYQKILVMDSMLQGQEEERKRIAQDLHDGLGTLLVSARLQMQHAQNQLDTIMQLPILENTENIINNACKEVRRIAHDMMPSALIDLGFIEAVEDLTADLSSQGQLQVDLKVADHFPQLNDAAALNLYRIIQEILQNIVKHAYASTVGISLISEPNQLVVEVSDDGVGFDTESVTGGIGLRNIRSRVDYLNGAIQIESKPNQGCTYSLSVPLPAA